MPIAVPEHIERWTPERRLRFWVDEWKRIREEIKNPETTPSGLPGAPEISTQDLQKLYEERREANAEIDRIVGNHPRLYDEAIKFGYPEGPLAHYAPPTSGEATTGEVKATGSGGDGGGGGGGPGPTQDKKTGGGNAGVPASGGNWLFGTRGVDYILRRWGGNVYAVYNEKLANGLTFRYSYRIKDRQLEAHGIDPSKIQVADSKEHGSWAYLGTSDEQRIHGHTGKPLDKFFKDLFEQHPGATFLHDREVMSIFAQGFIEKKDQSWLDNMLHNTKWFQSRTAYQRQWEEVLSGADKRAQIKLFTQNTHDALRDLFGTVRWQDHIDGDKLKDWIHKVASGAWGDPNQAANELISSLTRQAEKIEGTTAWLARQKDLSEQRAELNKPEDMAEQLRNDQINWLGYGGQSSKDYIQRWAEDLVSGRKSQADWEQHLRSQAQHLYPFLGPDEKWMDRASIFKNIAEQTFGTPITWDDKILRDFTAKDKDGNPLNGGKTAMTAWDFEQKARGDNRFRSSKNGIQGGQSIASGIAAFMTGEAS